MTASKADVQRREELEVLVASPGWKHVVAWAEQGIQTQLNRILQRGLDHRQRDIAVEAVSSTQAILAYPGREIERIATKDETPDRGVRR